MLTALLEVVRETNPPLYTRLMPHVNTIREIRRDWAAYQRARAAYQATGTGPRPHPTGVFVAGEFLVDPREEAIHKLEARHLAAIRASVLHGRKNRRAPDDRWAGLVLDLEGILANAERDRQTSPERGDEIAARAVARCWREARLEHDPEITAEAFREPVPDHVILRARGVNTPRAAALAIVQAVTEIDADTLARQVRRAQRRR